VSEITQRSPAFFTLYSEGRVTADQVHDYVEAWHESGDEESRPLPEYLGMSDDEYNVWLMMTFRALPIILAARRANRPLRDFVAPFYDKLRAAGDPEDRSVLHTMAYWLERQPPAGDSSD
jgi:hypothetical protein